MLYLSERANIRCRLRSKQQEKETVPVKKRIDHDGIREDRFIWRGDDLRIIYTPPASKEISDAGNAEKESSPSELSPYPKRKKH